MSNLFQCVVLFCMFVFPLIADTIKSAPPVQAVKISEPILIDGKLNESVWKTKQSISNFIQRDPDNGSTSTQRTEVWVAYDLDALYIAARLFDSHPDSIMKVLGRKDNLSTADWFGVFLDPYRDKRSGNFFVLGSAGTVADGVLYNDDWDDVAWDGVWEGKTSIDEQGWIAEMRIPFSQLRFKQEEKSIWGIMFRRDIGRRNETDYIIHIPRNESGFVSRFSELTGIEGIKPSNAVEVLPFVTSKHERTHPASGNPFNKTGVLNKYDIGADLKYGISSNLILDATINPDFGQVEVDPAVVNLSDVESFFQEKRPFFIEGANTFSNFGRGGGRNFWNFNFPTANLFYSRRIGRAPKGSVSNADFLDAPIATSILGAGKITGKLGDGWNVGTIHAVTEREFAQKESSGIRSSPEIEPLTYYGVFRIQKEINESRQGLGIIGTLTSRNFSDLRLKDQMNNTGAFAGLDGWTFLDAEKAWVITGWAGASRVEGTTKRITKLQTNSGHYFQRPDATHLKLDTNATSLIGYAGRFYLIKQKGNFFFNSAFGFIDPKFEINDLGFLSRTDVINMHIGGGYSWPEPNEIFRSLELGGAIGQNYDFEKNLTNNILFHFGNIQFLNYYGINWNLAVNPTEMINTRRTRGGPLTIEKPAYEISLNARSDDRKDVSVETFVSSSTSEQSNSFSYGAFILFRPAPNVSFSVGPDFGTNVEKLQWIDAVFNDPLAIATFGKRYIFGELEQKTLSANIRLNWTFTPQLSLQLFVQPLIVSGKYNNFKELSRAKSNDYLVYGTNGSSITSIKNSNNEIVNYIADSDGAGAANAMTFGNPNFNFKSLRGNAVLRWEYLPGSAMYFVWTQSRSDNENIGEFQFRNSLDRIGKSQPDNIFLIKMSYYFSM